VNSFEGVHHRKCPIAYPNSAPVTEPNKQTVANLKAFFDVPRTSAISSASGGMGKKEDSAKARRKSAAVPYGVLDQ
jgi:hypothetical protein